MPVDEGQTAGVFLRRFGELPLEHGDQSGRDQRASRVRTGDIFRLAAEFLDMPTTQIKSLLAHSCHQVRVGALSIMDKQARHRGTPDRRRAQLYDLHIRRIDLIDTWDLVDIASPHVIGGYLFDRPREPLYALARSPMWWARRCAIVSTLYLVRHGQTGDTFALAGILARDDEHYVQTAVGGLLREAGKRDPDALRSFLNDHADTLPRTTLGIAVERLDAEERRRWRERRDRRRLQQGNSRRGTGH
jgi:3-methyladenine DNA glycosylase AlkD